MFGATNVRPTGPLSTGIFRISNILFFLFFSLQFCSVQRARPCCWSLVVNGCVHFHLVDLNFFFFSRTISIVNDGDGARMRFANANRMNGIFCEPKPALNRIYSFCLFKFNYCQHHIVREAVANIKSRTCHSRISNVVVAFSFCSII